MITCKVLLFKKFFVHIRGYVNHWIASAKYEPFVSIVKILN